MVEFQTDKGIEWVDTAEVADAGRLVVLLAVIYRY